MFCSHCGKESPEGTLFCAECGKKFNSSPPAATPAQTSNPPRSPLIGFSTKINDPAFKKYKKKSAAWSLIFASILFVAAVIGFPIYGKTSGDIDWPNSLYYGLGIGGMFLVIAVGQTLKRGFDKTWDGVVKDKKTYREVDRSDNGHTHYHTVYKVRVKKDKGGTKTHKWRDTPGLFDYYSVGDKVRHHKGFFYYEKYDKSQDTQIMCAACMAFNDVNNENCERCKCPLLK